jgi:hypothetical protein
VSGPTTSLTRDVNYVGERGREIRPMHRLHALLGARQPEVTD